MRATTRPGQGRPRPVVLGTYISGFPCHVGTHEGGGYPWQLSVLDDLSGRQLSVVLGSSEAWMYAGQVYQRAGPPGPGW